MASLMVMTSPQQGQPDTDVPEAVRQIFKLISQEMTGLAMPTTISLGPFTTYLMIAILQLAWRHPGLTEFNRNFVEGAARELQNCYKGTPLYDFVEKGWDEALDVVMPELNDAVVGVHWPRVDAPKPNLS